MGNLCCRGRCGIVVVAADHGAGGGVDMSPWQEYIDRDEEFLPPSSSAERRRRGVATTSLTNEEIIEMSKDLSRPRRAEHATQELERRAACDKI